MPTPLALTAELFIDGAWTAYPAYSEQGWSTQVGPDIEAGSQPSSLSVRLQNDNLELDPDRPASTLYGKIGLNTPARVLLSGTVIGAGEASEWKPDRTQEHTPGANRGVAWVDIKAEGLLRRIGKWDDPLESPMSRQIRSYPALLGYYRLEDPAGATGLANEVPTGVPGSYSGTVTLAGDPGAGGADTAVELGSDGVIGGSFVASAVSGWQFCWVAKLAALPATATPIAMMQWSDTTGRMWYWRVSSSGYQIEVADSSGTSLAVSNVGFTGNGPTTWTRYRLRCTVSAGTITFEPAWYEQDAPSVFGVTGTFAGSTTGQPAGWASVANVHTDGAAIGHLFATADATLNLTSAAAAVQSFNGFLDETAPQRFARLMTEGGFSYAVSGDINGSVAMGRQRPGRLLDLLEETVRTDGGLMYDDPALVRTVFRLENNMRNLTAALALTYSVDIAPPLKRVVDDVKVINDITIKNWDGTEIRRELTTGRKSTAVPPSGVGRYKATLEVSMHDTTKLADRLNFELRDATVDRSRYESVSVDLLANPGMRATVNVMRPGDLITVAGVEPDPAPLRVMSIARAGGAVAELVTFVCRPADVWDSGVYDDGVHRYDSGNTLLSAGATSTATTLLLVTEDVGDTWSQVSAYDIVIEGERIGVPIGGASAPAGTGPYTQTLTGVTRSKNGVVKAQSSGKKVRVYKPAIWGR